MAWNTLDAGLELFSSRAVQGREARIRVEKQNTGTGLMPVIANEAAAHGDEPEDRHFVRAFWACGRLAQPGSSNSLRNRANENRSISQNRSYLLCL